MRRNAKSPESWRLHPHSLPGLSLHQESSPYRFCPAYGTFRQWLFLSHALTMSEIPKSVPPTSSSRVYMMYRRSRFLKSQMFPLPGCWQNFHSHPSGRPPKQIALQIRTVCQTRKYCTFPTMTVLMQDTSCSSIVCLQSKCNPGFLLSLNHLTRSRIHILGALFFIS